MKNIEIFIPTWPDAQDLIRKIGTGDYGLPVGGVDSFGVNFRAQQTSEGYLPEWEHRCWRSIGMTIFVHKDGMINLNIRALNVSSADLAQLEHLVKSLKWVDKRKDLVSSTGLKLDSLPFYLMNLCTVLGIHRTVQYHGVCVDESFAPVSEALALIVAEAKRRWERLQ